MRCPHCGHWNRAHYRACIRCGASLKAPVGAADSPSKESDSNVGKTPLAPPPPSAAMEEPQPTIRLPGQPPAPIPPPKSKSNVHTEKSSFDPTSILARLMDQRKPSEEKRPLAPEASPPVAPPSAPAPPVGPAAPREPTTKPRTKHRRPTAATQPFYEQATEDAPATAKDAEPPRPREETENAIRPPEPTPAEVGIAEEIFEDAINLAQNVRPFVWSGKDDPPTVPFHRNDIAESGDKGKKSSFAKRRSPQNAVREARKPPISPPKEKVEEAKPKPERPAKPHVKRYTDPAALPPISKVQAKRRPPIWRNLLPILYLCVMIAIGYGGYRGYLWVRSILPEPSQDLRTTASVDDSLPPPMIETGVVQNEPVHILVFSGNDGDFITIPEYNGKNLQIVAGTVRVTIPDKFWIGDSPGDDQERYQVLLNPKLITVAGIERRMAPVEYSIEVPLSPIELIEPKEREISTYASTQRIQFRITPGSSVYLDDNDIRDLVDKNGLVAQNIRVKPEGENIVEIAVKTPGCRKNIVTLTITRPYMDIPIDINPPESTSTSNVSIRGTTDPGASITVETNHSDLKHDSTLGSFSFTAKLDKIGMNTIVITAKKEGREDSQIRVNINYEPEYGEYADLAWNFQAEYNFLISNTQQRMGQIYRVDGKIISIEPATSDAPMLVYFDGGGSSGKSMPVYMEYSGTKIWEMNRSMSVFGHVIGTHDGLPLLQAMYIRY